MAQQEDVLFCKIAINNGLVSEQDAQKALALCEKKEKEEGKRPQIGAVFAKYNLLKTQDVQKIYDAVRKRSGSSAGSSAMRAPSRSQRPPSPSKSRNASGRAPGSGSARASSSREAQPRAKGRPDQQTLLIGIAGLLALVVISGVIVYIVLSQSSVPGDKTAKDKGANADTSAAEKNLIEASKARPPKAAGALPAEEQPLREAPREFLAEINTGIADSLQHKADDPRQGLAIVEKLAIQCDQRGYRKPPRLLEAIAELREAASKAGPQKDAGEGEKKDAAPEAKAAPPPGEKKDGKSDAPADDTDMEKLLEDK